MLEQYSVIQTVAPTVEPLTLADVRTWLRVDDDDSTQDALIVGLIRTAREFCENETGRQLCTATWVLRLDAFPPWEIEVPRPRLATVTSIQYVDTAGVLQTIDASLYTVDTYSEPGEIVPVYGEVWPTARDEENAVRITYTAGYGGAAAVPACVKQAMRLLITADYEQRTPGPLELDRVRALLDTVRLEPYR